MATDEPELENLVSIGRRCSRILNWLGIRSVSN